MSFATNKILLLFFWVMCFNSFAQKEFITYTKGDGLTSSNILFTKVDHKGIIWAATNSGLVVFIGDEWVTVKSISDQNGNNKNLGRVIKIFEATNGKLWVATEKGYFVFNGKSWTYYYDRDNEGFIITDIFEDRQGWIWVIHERLSELKDVGNIGFSLVEGTIQSFNGRQWFKYPGMIGGSAAVEIGDTRNYFTSHMQDKKGNLWVTSLEGLYKFYDNSWTEYNEEQLPSDHCFKVIETSNNDIWVAAKYGIALQVGDDWVKYEKHRGVKGNLIYDLFEDKENRLWAFAEKDNRFNSLCLFEDSSWKPYFKENIKIKGSINRLIDFEDKLIAFSRKGLSVYDGKNWKNLIKKHEIDDDNFSNLIIAKNKEIWLAGQNGLYNLNSDGIRLVFSPENSWKVTSVFESYTGEIWVGTEKNGIYLISGEKNNHYTIDNGLNDNYIKEVFEDKNRKIWVVTRGGISRYN